MDNGINYKKLYIDLLKKSGNTCDYCINQIPCESKKCPSYIEGESGELNGKEVKFHWTCEHFNFGTCPVLENTPCNGCIENGMSGFCLNEKLLMK